MFKQIVDFAIERAKPSVANYIASRYGSNINNIQWLRNNLRQEHGVTTTIADLDTANLFHALRLYCEHTGDGTKKYREIRDLTYRITHARNVVSHAGATDITIQQARRWMEDIYDLYNILEINNGDMQNHTTALRDLLTQYQTTIYNRFGNAPHVPEILALTNEQRPYAFHDYDGSSLFNGVSGSGKTTILIHRAIALSNRRNGVKILIVCLNKALSDYIKSILRGIMEVNEESFVVTSFYELCQKYIFKHVTNQREQLEYSTTTWKNDEHIDEIWREYYRQEAANDDAKVLQPLHIRINAKNIDPEQYFKEEFDLIRHNFGNENRLDYLTMARTGRVIGFSENDRRAMLKGLECWEAKMKAVGISDYPKITNTLLKYYDRLEPEYDHTLIDEGQDFSTTEFKIIRKLTKNGPNDIAIFMDYAQKVYHKPLSLDAAAIDLPADSTVTFLQNLRNTKQILSAADNVRKRSLNTHNITDDSTSRPQPSAFDYSKPYILHANDNELSYIFAHINNLRQLNHRHSICVAICGFSWIELYKYAKANNFKILDGYCYDISGEVFISDLEQVKGYEFDTVIIANCCANTLPPKDLDIEFYKNEINKLYVTMTRARLNLIISYTTNLSLSPWIAEAQEYFETTSWDYFVPHLQQIIPGPQKLPEITQEPDKELINFTGKEFIYSDKARGCSIQLQVALLKYIDGVTHEVRNSRFLWHTVHEAIHSPDASHVLGEELFDEFMRTWSSIRFMNL